MECLFCVYFQKLFQELCSILQSSLSLYINHIQFVLYYIKYLSCFDYEQLSSDLKFSIILSHVRLIFPFLTDFFICFILSFIHHINISNCFCYCIILIFVYIQIYTFVYNLPYCIQNISVCFFSYFIFSHYSNVLIYTINY